MNGPDRFWAREGGALLPWSGHIIIMGIGPICESTNQRYVPNLDPHQASPDARTKRRSRQYGTRTVVATKKTESKTTTVGSALKRPNPVTWTIFDQIPCSILAHLEQHGTSHEYCSSQTPASTRQTPSRNVWCNTGDGR